MNAVAWLSLMVAMGFLLATLDASAGDASRLYRICVGQCERTGLAGDISIQHCHFQQDNAHLNSPWYMKEPLYSQWKQINCRIDCRYHCMMQREIQRKNLGLKPVKYHGKWPFKRVSVFQEPASAIFSALNLLAHITGWLSFFRLVSYKLPLRPQNERSYYEFTGLWHIYGLLSTNAWFWSTIFHTRYKDFDLTEKLDYSSVPALLGFSLILSLLRAFNVRDEASRVMISAPILAFTTTHILYLNFYKIDYGWQMKVCVAMMTAHLLVWTIWAGVTNHPSRFKLWTVMFGVALASTLEIGDFPPHYGYFDAHSLWHLATIPLTCLWWSFVKSDAKYRTEILVRKVK